MDFRERSYSRGADDKQLKPTTRINDETWERFKPFLCGLYKKYTLSIVMDIMEKKYGIIQSKRQYGYRFEKWGIKKYNASDKKSPIMSLSPGGIAESIDFGDIELDLESRSFDRHSALDFTDGDTLMTTPGSDDMDYDGSLDSKELLIQYPWSTGSIEEARKLAADFCAAMLDDSNAFNLYLNLHQSVANSDHSLRETREFLVISCARVAGKPDNACSARELLAKEWPYEFSKSPFLLSMLKAYVGSHQEDSDKSHYIQQVTRNVEQILASDQSLPEMTHNYSSIDLVTFFFLNYAFEIYDERFDQSNPPEFMTENLLHEFIKKQPFIKTLRHDRPSPLRCCVEWCEEQLRLNHPVALQDSPVNPSADMRSWWHNIRVFCTLWGVMVQLVRANRAPDWYSQCESAFGISPSELLVTLSWMIRAETTADDVIQGDDELLEHAADGASNLLDLDEPKLWINFFYKFAWMNELVSPGEDEKSFETLVQDQLRKYVSDVLRIQLPHQPSNQPATVANMNMYNFTSPGFTGFDINPQIAEFYS
ncbi:uncharacterized protein B0J16DRAFT_409683 [Fusarium flagelliforme]|uniref:Clr5 domain-containing protein n=1 Tax=Fusarium flagelliforme TaxID=2675880 RepID=A0A395MJV5_9HYPO|nr:uncharacterized protein B0J16DRAFT_409683 [Fusarium flagelliforme]KAH7198128.1 hypothetical protein B0J16DRAFT_409683 [Fusarium flagelliforme]RFN48218.1 hypothetical protein FIE12Z_7547 [Fusarium flagelliforme]